MFKQFIAYAINAPGGRKMLVASAMITAVITAIGGLLPTACYHAIGLETKNILQSSPVLDTGAIDTREWTVCHATSSDQKDTLRQKLEADGHEFSTEAFFEQWIDGDFEIVVDYWNAGIARQDGFAHQLLQRDDLPHVETLFGKANLCGADLNERDDEGDTPLMRTLRNGDSRMAAALVVAGADPSVKNEYGQTPLHIAGLNDLVDIAEAMVEAGVDVDILDGDGRTPLYTAFFTEDTETAEVLIEAGANIHHHYDHQRNETDTEWTVLHHAARNGRTELLELFVEYGGDPNYTMDDGWQPLHYAVSRGQSRTVRYLVRDLDVNVNDPTDMGWTPLAIAQTLEDDDFIAPYLANQGAVVDPDDAGEVR